jgi:hypothetical protein
VALKRAVLCLLHVCCRHGTWCLASIVFPPTNEEQEKEDQHEKDVHDVISTVDQHGRCDLGRMEFPAPSSNKTKIITHQIFSATFDFVVSLPFNRDRNLLPEYGGNKSIYICSTFMFIVQF